MRMRSRRTSLIMWTIALTVGSGASVGAEDVWVPTLTVAAIGDVLPGIYYERAIGRGLSPFRNLTPLLERADVALANLETPISDRGTAVSKRFTFRVPPARARLLAQAGLDVVGLGNNHLMDYGPEAMEDTCRHLAEAGIRFCGAGSNREEAGRAVSVPVGECRVGVLSFNLTFPRSFWAGADSPGTAFGEERHVRRAVRQAAREHDAVIVLYHWGRENEAALRDYQRTMAGVAAKSGAALVIGTHPHRFQGVQQIGETLVAYSLGDGVFGGANTRSVDSLVLRAVFGSRAGRRSGGGALKVISAEFLPLNASNAHTRGAPRVRTDGGAGVTLDQLESLARRLDTVLTRTTTAEGYPCLRYRRP